MKTVPGAVISPRRRVLFRLVLLAPAVLLGLVALAVLVRLVKLRWGDASAVVVERTPDVLTQFRPPTQATLEAGVPGVYRDGQWVRLDRQGATRLVHVLGGSSVVLPSASEAFPGRLQAALDPRTVRVANLGQVGMTSVAIAMRGESALELGRPDVVVFYEGHNDTTLTFGESLQQDLGFFRSSLVLQLAAAPWLVGSLAVRWKSLGLAVGGWSRVLELDIEPVVMAEMGRRGVIGPDPRAVEAAGRLARTLFLQSLGPLLEAARARQAVVVLVTPISNLEFAPVGLGPEAEEVFASGMAAQDRTTRLALLRRARDLDVFNGSIRAKSDLLQAMRDLDDGRMVQVLDLERALESDPSFGFGYDAFFDSVHLKPEAHERVATLLLAFLRERGLLEGSRAPEDP